MNDEMQIDCCPVCKKPCHATEGDEMGRHPKCQTAPKLTEAQRRYLAAIGGADDVLRPRAAGGKYGDLNVIHRLQEKGLVDERTGITDAGRAALRGGK